MSTFVRRAHGQLIANSGGSVSIDASGGDMLVVALIETISAAITGVTFNGVAMTERANLGGARIYTLNYPAPGTYNVTVTSTSGTGYIETEVLVISKASMYLDKKTGAGNGYTATLATQIIGDFMVMAGKCTSSISDSGSGSVNTWYVDGSGRVSYKYCTSTPTDTIAMSSVTSGNYAAVSVGDVPDSAFDVPGMVGI